MHKFFNGLSILFNTYIIIYPFIIIKSIFNMKTLVINLTIVLAAMLISACASDKTHNPYMLKLSNKSMVFNIDTYSKNDLFVYSIYEDKNGQSHFTFQNPNGNTVLFYDLNTQALKCKLNLPIEGNNGVGFANGYYIHNLDSIYIPNRDIEEISLINQEGILITKYSYEKENLSLFDISSAYLKQPTIIGRTMYLYSGPNRYIEHDPVSIKFDMDTHEVTPLPFDYPEYPGSDIKLKKYGLETAFSRCFDGEHFVYSFYYDENIYIATPEHDTIRKIPVRSKYFNKVTLPNELTASPEDFCENSWYGNLLYDPYREVYYRIAFPKTDLDKGVNPIELARFGRKNFSIIILNKDFEIIGETKFPDYTFNSNIMFIQKDGLYISDSHYLNPQFNDDILSFKCFSLIESDQNN